jgi:hypothetical protein
MGITFFVLSLLLVAGLVAGSKATTYQMFGGLLLVASLIYAICRLPASW